MSESTKKKKSGRKGSGAVNSEVTAIIIILILVIIIITLIAVAISFLNKGKSSETGKNNVIVVNMPDSSETAESLVPAPTNAPAAAETDPAAVDGTTEAGVTETGSTADPSVITPTEPAATQAVVETAAPAEVETAAPATAGTVTDVNYTFRASAGTVQYSDHSAGSATIGTIGEQTTITIVQEYTDESGVKWGKAKSGYWIRLS